MTILFALIIAILLGSINAVRGSGYFQTTWMKTSVPIKWVIVPLIMYVSASVLSAPWWLSVLFIAPYAWKMGTGTGGDIQAIKGGICNAENCKEFKPFDIIVDWCMKKIMNHSRWYYNSNTTYCECWGFVYCILTSFVFAVPFIFTNIWYGLLMLGYPFLVRFTDSWRRVEFLFIYLYSYYFLVSL